MLKQYIFLFHHRSMLSRTLTLISLLAFMAISFQSVASESCNQLIGCEQKYCEISQQLNAAKQYNNKNKIKGLTTALDQAKAHCSNAKLKEELTEKISEAKKELADYDADLIAAESAGKKQKVNKYQNKIKEEEVKIKQWEVELTKLKPSPND
ncbi:DUF1090 domain-containing protein [uncultured Shewanella sp.]|uniref:DUF1090 domain-containing protein n=1 Tax=uncultured Shewanella sp. TaxID=173975 RepID=UPI0026135E66|nr:DUF1090 domain-containing protein [uncultured Shewanella sp.]